MSNNVEESNQRIVDAISRKESFTIRTIDECDNNGSFDIYLQPPFRPRRSDASFRIYLIDFATTNLVANVNDSNNKFYYNNGTNEKMITVPSGFYLIDSYNTEVKRLVKANSDQDDAITISINDSTGLVTVALSKNYSVLFNKSNTFRDNLGFTETVLRGNQNHQSSKTANLWPTQNIYIHCSVVKGNKLITNKRCTESDIIYNFPCNQKYGAPITYQLSPRLTESDLTFNAGQLDSISIKFTDDNNKPITFGKSQINLALRIWQV